MPTNQTNRLSSYQRRIKPLRKSIRFVFDQESEEALKRAQFNLTMGEMNAKNGKAEPEELDGLRAAVREAEQKVAKHSIKFTFEGLGNKKHDQLMAEHAITEDEREQFVSDGKVSKEQSANLLTNPITLMPALAEAALVEVDGKKITLREGEWAEFLETSQFTHTEIDQIYNTVAEACNGSRSVRLGNA